MMLRPYDRNYVGALWRRVTIWVQRDAVYRELAALDERGLKDIGITRGDIPAVVAGQLRRGGRKCDGVGCTTNHPVRCASTPPRK